VKNSVKSIWCQALTSYNCSPFRWIQTEGNHCSTTLNWVLGGIIRPLGINPVDAALMCEVCRLRNFNGLFQVSSKKNDYGSISKNKSVSCCGNLNFFSHKKRTEYFRK
jgi:hypothetical protein